MKLFESFIKELKKKKDPVRAAHDAKYHKSSREHLGVNSAGCKSVVRSFVKRYDEDELIQLAKDLWASGVFDAMISSALILESKKIKPSKKLWRVIMSFMKDLDGWALEDTLSRAARECIVDDQKLLDEVEKWTHHKNFWMRRAALIFTLPFAKPDMDPERMLKWAANYSTDEEWFIQKAIGWWLRDLGQHNPKRVIDFLNQYWKDLKGVAKKEATRKLEQKYLQQIKHLS